MKLYKEYYDTNERNKTHKYYNNKINSDTIRYQNKYKFELNMIKGHETWNVEADAFKHAYGSALMSLDRDDFFSYVAGYNHEKMTPNNPSGEYKMDTHNNKIGRKIAKDIKKQYADKWDKLSQKEKEDIIADRVWKHMQAGDLILSPDGRRKLKGVNVNENKKSDCSSDVTTQCVGSYPVSGYTRSDGKEVKGYIRTCGAKHLGYQNSKSIAEDRERVLEKYKGRKAQDMSKSEIEEFFSVYFS